MSGLTPTTKTSLTIDTQTRLPTTATAQEVTADRTSGIMLPLQYCESPTLPPTPDSPDSTLSLYFNMQPTALSTESPTTIRFIQAVTPEGFYTSLSHHSWTVLPKIIPRSQSCSTISPLPKPPLKRSVSV